MAFEDFLNMAFTCKKSVDVHNHGWALKISWKWLWFSKKRPFQKKQEQPTLNVKQNEIRENIAIWVNLMEFHT